MKILYVGDNRNRGNYGCRATSTALSQIIAKENEIVGFISGRYTNFDNGELFFYKYFPGFIYKTMGKIKYWNSLKTGFYLFARMIKRHKYFFSNFDFINYDLDKSIKNLIKCLPANEHLREMDLRQYDFDAMVVNGEGSFIFSSPPWRECLIELMLMYWALKLGKKVYYMNGMLSDDPFTPHNKKTINVAQKVFEKCEVVSVREYYSKKYATKYFNNINLKYYPDALFSWFHYINDDFKINNGKYVIGMSGASNDSYEKFDFSKPYILVSGSSSLSNSAKYKDEPVDVYINLVNKIKNEFKKYNIFIIVVCEGDMFLNEVGKNTNTPVIPIDTPILSAGKILARAKCFISGRYHPGILASLGGTPCTFMSSNSHKTKSIQELLKYENIKEFDNLPNDKEIERIIDDARKKILQGEKLRNKIKERCKELSCETIKQKELFNENE